MHSVRTKPASRKALNGELPTRKEAQSAYSEPGRVALFYARSAQQYTMLCGSRHMRGDTGCETPDSPPQIQYSGDHEHGIARGHRRDSACPETPPPWLASWTAPSWSPQTRNQAIMPWVVVVLNHLLTEDMMSQDPAPLLRATAVDQILQTIPMLPEVMAGDPAEPAELLDGVFCLTIALKMVSRGKADTYPQMHHTRLERQTAIVPEHVLEQNFCYL